MISIKGDILDVQAGIICHQINCQGTLGAGLAKQLKDRYPKVRTDYYTAYHSKKLKLGEVIFTTIKPGYLYVANMCGQDNFQRVGMGFNVLHTDYNALERCFIKVVNFAQSINEKVALPVYMPYKVGCGLARGNWSIVAGIIQKIAPNSVIVNNRE